MNTTIGSQSISRNSRGVSLVSVLIAVVIIGILGALAYPKFVGTRDLTIDNAKKANVSRLNELSATAVNLGATIGAGASNNIDTTTVTTSINCFNNGFVVANVPIKLEPSLTNFGSYTTSTTTQSVVFSYNAGNTYLP